MSFIRKLAGKINLLDFRLEQLVEVTTPNKNKILLDVAIKLYDDEVGRYRWLEEKAMRIFTIDLFLVTSMATILSWLFINYSYVFNEITLTIIIVAFVLAISSMLYIVELLRTIEKPAISISSDNIAAANDDKELYNEFYSGLLKEVYNGVLEYRDVNREKEKGFKLAYKYLLYLLLSICILTLIILFFIFFMVDVSIIQP